MQEDIAGAQRAAETGHAAAAIAECRTWYHQIEVAPGVVTPGTHASALGLTYLRLPDDLSGERVLDLGARDGFYAFACERRGADVLAVDYVPAERTGFAIASRLLGSHVAFLHRNVHDLTPAEVGTFDVVLMLGLLYHLPDPLRALFLVRALCRRSLYLETLVCDHRHPELADLPVAVYLRDSYDDGTNYWAPSVRCLEQMLWDAGFAVDGIERYEDRAYVRAHVDDDRGRSHFREISLGRVTP